MASSGVKFPGTTKRASVLAPTRVHWEINYDAASGVYTVPIPAGCFVTDIAWFVQTAFTTSGSNASLTIGDGDGADYYADATDTALQTQDTVLAKASGAGQTKATGDFYESADTVDFTFVKATSGATAGRVVGYVEYSALSNDGIATT